ncbi:MAG: glycosyltransferase family 39 protein [Deltaproteobacteria bacterium]|nr:glycosyltransferase family 39 protein [Deltaproteobacteria bacterium]
MAAIASATVRLWHIFLLIGLCAALYFPYLASTPFFDKGEPREAMAVQDIMNRGEWLVPLKRATDVPSKPPLFHWSAAAVSTLAGQMNEATIRFPSALYATLGVLLVYFLGGKLFGADTALLGAAILATTLVYGDQALSARVDMTLCFYVTLSLGLFYAIYRGFLRSGVWLYVFYGLVGISTLAKGPLGILLPALVCASLVLLERRWDWLGKFCVHPGVLLMLILGAGWYVIAVSRGGEGFFSRQIVSENLARFAGGSGHSHPVYYYVSYLFSLGMPWAVFFPLLFWDYGKRRWFADGDKLFLGLWFVVIFLFFSISAGKRPVYLLPIYPALALLLAVWLRQMAGAGTIRRWLLRLIALNAVLVGAALLLITLGALWNHDAAWFFEPIGKLLRAKDRANFFVVRDSLADFGNLFTLVALASAALWLGLGQALWRYRLRAAAVLLIVNSILFGFVAHRIVVPAIAETKSYKPFMAQVNQRVQSKPLYLFGEFNSDPVLFYRGQTIPMLRASVAEIAPTLGQGQRYLIMTESAWKEMQKATPALPAPLFTSSGTGPEGDARLVLTAAR